MVTLFAMYKHPADAAAFDKYYVASHVPIAKRLPGLQAYDITRGPVTMPGGARTPYHLIALLTFASQAAVDAALASPEGQATVADLGNFATGGVDIMMAETAPV